MAERISDRRAILPFTSEPKSLRERQRRRHASARNATGIDDSQNPERARLFALGRTLRRAERAASGSGIGDRTNPGLIGSPSSPIPSHLTLEQLLAGKSETELRAIAEAEVTAETAKAAYHAAYEELRIRKLPNAITGRWRLLPIAGKNGVPLSAATPTYDESGQPQSRQAITQDEAEFLAHAERLFRKA